MASLLLMRDRANLAERQARAEQLLLRHPYSAAIASELAQIIAQGKQDPERALALARRSSRFDRGRHSASLAAFQAVADAGVQPQAGAAQAALEPLKPRENPSEAGPPADHPGAHSGP